MSLSTFLLPPLSYPHIPIVNPVPRLYNLAILGQNKLEEDRLKVRNLPRRAAAIQYQSGCDTTAKSSAPCRGVLVTNLRNAGVGEWKQF